VLAGYGPWDGWNGWEVHGGLLFPPGYRRNGAAPGEFFAQVYYRQAVSEYRRRCEQLEAQVGQGVQNVQEVPLRKSYNFNNIKSLRGTRSHPQYQ
jgi:hypothetical protein